MTRKNVVFAMLICTVWAVAAKAQVSAADTIPKAQKAVNPESKHIYGFYLGTNTVHGVGERGITLGALADFRLAQHTYLEFAPALSMYTYYDHAVNLTREASVIQLPVMAMYHFGNSNCRPYLGGGGALNYDLVSGRFSSSLDAAFGYDLRFKTFAMAPQIKYSWQASGPQMWYFTFAFKGAR